MIRFLLSCSFFGRRFQTRRAIFPLLFSVSLLLIPVSFKRLTCGFKLAKLRLDAPYRSDWEAASSLSYEELRAILEQPYSYLDKGAQCYVFASQDGQYVVKLFRYDQPCFVKTKTKAPLRDKIEKLFSASVIAYSEAREETGLVYVHLNLTENRLPLLRAKGPIGQSLSLPLDRYRFAIQKRAEPFRASFETSFADPETCKRRIDSFLALLRSRTEKGIGNTDPTLSRNFGFLGDRAVEIDFGNYYKAPDSLADVARYAARLRRFFEREAPGWTAYLDEKLAEGER
jgi:hypothetical protein